MSMTTQLSERAWHRLFQITTAAIVGDERGAIVICRDRAKSAAGSLALRPPDSRVVAIVNIGAIGWRRQFVDVMMEWSFLHQWQPLPDLRCDLVCHSMAARAN